MTVLEANMQVEKLERMARNLTKLYETSQLSDGEPITLMLELEQLAKIDITFAKLMCQAANSIQAEAERWKKIINQTTVDVDQFLI